MGPVILYWKGGTLTVSVNIIFNYCLLHFQDSSNEVSHDLPLHMKISQVRPLSPQNRPFRAFYEVENNIFNKLPEFLVDEIECYSWISTHYRSCTGGLASPIYH